MGVRSGLRRCSNVAMIALAACVEQARSADVQALASIRVDVAGVQSGAFTLTLVEARG